VLVNTKVTVQIFVHFVRMPNTNKARNTMHCRTFGILVREIRIRIRNKIISAENERSYEWA